MSADKQLKAFIDRVLRLKEEQDALAQDIREVYAEAKMTGYDKTVMGKLVAYLRKIEKAGPEAANEAEAVFDTYLDAYQRASGMRIATHTHEEQFDPITGEFIEEQNTHSGAISPPGSAAVVSSSHNSGNEEVAPIGLLANQPETATEQRVNVHSQHEGANAQATVQNECVTVVGTESGTVANPVANVGEDFADESAASSVDPASRTDDVRERQHASTVGFADDCRTGGKEQVAAAPVPVGDAAAYAHGIPDIIFEAVPPAPMKRPTFASCFPEISGNAYNALAADIHRDGIQEPIVRMGDQILDGWARYNIARSLGIEYPVIAYRGDDVLLDVIRLQRSARDFTPAQERRIADQLAKQIPGRAEAIFAAFHIEELETA